MGGSGRFKDDAGFKKVAERLMSEIMKRDQEDGDKLAKGIQLAIDKKVGWGTLGWAGWGREGFPRFSWKDLGGKLRDMGNQ